MRSCEESDPASAERNLLETRSSLLLGLKDSANDKCWRQFFDIYWKLLYNVTRKSGFPPEDAEDIVQQTISTVARNMPGFEYDRRKGSFRGWLMRILRSRIVDAVRKRHRRVQTVEWQPDREDIGDDQFELLWDREWSKSLVNLALGRVKQQVKPKQYQIFHAYVVKEWTMQEVMDTLGVSQRQVYMAKYRVGEKFEEELRALCASTPSTA